MVDEKKTEAHDVDLTIASGAGHVIRHAARTLPHPTPPTCRGSRKFRYIGGRIQQIN